MDSAWKARWIWKPGPITINDYALFRQSFVLENAVKRAVVCVSAHHYLHFYVNGKRITGYGSPAPTTPPQTKYYMRYEISSLLVPGRNTVAAVVHYLGGGGQNYVDGFPGFLCQLELTAADGSVQVIATDESWEVCSETPYAIGRPYQQSRRLSAAELYDGNIAAKTAEWLQGDESGIPSLRAEISRIETADVPWTLKLQEIPEGREERVLRPEACGIQRIGLQVFDAGPITSGWVRVNLKGYPDTTIRVRYAERLDVDGRVSHYVSNEPSETYFDEYRMAGKSGSEMETWQPDFAYKAFRYFEITGYPGWIAQDNVEVVCAHTPLGEEGTFECSDPLLNAIFQASLLTQKNNVLGQVVDCPHREQAQYLADSDLQAETLTYYFEAQPVLRKVLTDFKDVMLPDGSFPFVSPVNFDRPEFRIQIPEWDLHFVSLLWKVYFTYDDAGIVKECYGTAARLIDALLEQKSAETGLLPKGEHWHISDWPYPSVDQEGPYLTVHHAKFYRALLTMKQLAEIAGYPQDADRYHTASVQLKADMLEHLYDDNRKRWKDCFGSDAYSQGTNALAVRCGLTPEADSRDIVSEMTREWTSRTVLSLELFRLLFEQGEQETAMQWLSRTEYPGWGYMMAQGSKTMWEGFEDIESHCHAWNGYPARLMADYLLGVRMKDSGFKRVAIAPYFSPKLTYAKGTIKTVRGDLHVRWDRKEEGMGLFIILPDGITADVQLPSTMSAPLELESGRHYITLIDGEVQYRKSCQP